MNRRRRRSAFTLIEVLLVLVILVILASLVVTAYGPIQQRANARAAKAQIGGFETAIGVYHTDMNNYPSSDQGLQALRQPPPDAGNRWAGPYLQKEVPMDPWGNPYRYAYPGSRNNSSFDIWSAGADGVDNTEDDIGNW